MNVLFSCCINDPWVEVAKELEKRSLINPVYWIGWKNLNNNEIQKTFSNIVFHNITDAWKGIFPDEINKCSEKPAHNGFMLDKFSYEELMCMKMMDRLDRDQSSFTFVERQNFCRNLIRNWTNILKVCDVDLIISPSIPHRVFDYALYIASRILKKKYLTFRMTPFPGHIIPMNDVSTIPNLTEGENKLNDEIKQYIEKNSASYKQAEPQYMKDQKIDAESSYFTKVVSKAKNQPGKLFKMRDEVSLYWKKANYSMAQTKFLRWEEHLYNFRAVKYKKELQEYYESKSVHPNLDEEYVFVALHYQPEETSCPSGNIYVDQIILVETLLNIFPDNIKIYVKEHKSQFMPKLEGETGRNKDFYDQLLKWDRVVLVSTDVVSFDLIDNAISVSTLTGTIGMESLIRNKPVIIFGNAWYEHFQGVIKIKDEEDVTFIKGILSGELQVDKDKITKQLNNLYHNCIKANHYKGVARRSSITTSESIENLTNYIINSYCE